MAVADAAMPRFQMGRVASRTFGVIGHNLLTFALLALIPGIPAAVMYSAWARFAGGLNPAERTVNIGAASLAFAAGAIYFIAYFIFQAGVVHATVVYLNGKRASFGDALSTGLKNFVPLLLLSIVVGFGVIGGMILLIVPGIILALMWSVAVPVRVVEHSGIGAALGRSSDLTRGHRWAIFGLVIAFVVLEIVVSSIAGALSLAQYSASHGGNAVTLLRDWTTSPSRLITSTVTALIYVVIAAAGVASIYYELRVIKEGIGPEALAAVFD